MMRWLYFLSGLAILNLFKMGEERDKMYYGGEFIILSLKRK